MCTKNMGEGKGVQRKAVRALNVEQNPVYAYVAKGFEIYNPFFSECGRFEVDPFNYYEITHEEVQYLIDLNNRHGYDWRL